MDGWTDEVAGLVRRFVEEFRRRSVGTYAASTTYGILLSVIPVLIVMSAIVPHTSLTEREVVDFILEILPDASASTVMAVCGQAYSTSTGLLPLSFVFLVWSSGFGMMQFRRGLNHICGVEESRNYVLVRLICSLYTLLSLALMFAVLLLQVFTGQIVDLWRSLLPYVEVPDLLTSALRYVVLFVAATLVLLLLYTTLPARPLPALSQLPGALAAAVGWEVFSGLFGLYVRYSTNLNAFYGSLFTVVILLLWVYWCIYIALLGALLNQFLGEVALPAGGSGDPRGRQGR